MAHKHNRRRVRHRTRRNKYDQSLPTVYETSSYDSLCAFSEPHLLCEVNGLSRQSTPSLDYSDNATLQNWTDARTSDYQNSSSDEHLYRVNTQEARALRTFGGEPGEDYDLVENMQKMFDSTYMEWTNT